MGKCKMFFTLLPGAKPETLNAELEICSIIQLFGAFKSKNHGLQTTLRCLLHRSIHIIPNPRNAGRQAGRGSLYSLNR